MTRLEMLQAIQKRDPNSWENEPKPIDYFNHKAWAISKFGHDAWYAYEAGNWDMSEV